MQYTYLKYLSSSTEDLITFFNLEKNSLLQLRSKHKSDSENYKDYISELDYKYVSRLIYHIFIHGSGQWINMWTLTLIKRRSKYVKKPSLPLAQSNV